MSVLFYITGHGFGHATRMAEVIRAGAPHFRSLVRTVAPARLLPGAHVEHATIDAAVAETPDTLHIDAAATLHHWIEFVGARHAIVEREAARVRASNIRLIVADIPFLAGEIAAAAGVPCVAIGNFTWGWILEPHFAHDPRGRDVLRAIDAGYALIPEYWRLPFSDPGDRSTFARVVETPLIAPPAKPHRRVDSRPTVLIGFRGTVPAAAFCRAAAECPDMLFLTVDDSLTAPNARYIHLSAEQSFHDLAAASDLIVAKLGYGLAATCSTQKYRLLHAPREGFREDAITTVEAARYAALRSLPVSDFESGNWRPHIEQLLAQPMPTELIRADGAEVCVERILELLNGRAG